MRYFFEISYNGSKYNGWQSQPNGRGIQSVVEDSLEKLLRERVAVTASGRTDAGVHCSQQFFHADISGDAGEQLLFRLNSLLPHDIAIHSITRVRPDAHARYDAFERTYKYRIVTRKNVFTQGLAWYFFKELDIQTMNEAATLLVGKHDFKCFSKVKTDVNNFVCAVTKADWTVSDGNLEFSITANRFLRGMVRAIVGTLVDVGLGRTSIAEFSGIIGRKDRREAGANVPAYGLYLVEVKYPDAIFELKDEQAF
jgi:tRNA pseudouridine38-40 synthase